MNLSTKNPDNTWTTGAEYYYVRNAQGDVVGLYDANGTQVVSYTYDSWGKPFVTEAENSDANDTVKDGITGSLASTIGVKNSYRYRGYRYDTETGLYYLNSRYYNPNWGRFINADDIGGKIGELLSHNMFAYCKNNPVNMVDPNGYSPLALLFSNPVTAIIGIVVIAALYYLTTPSGQRVLSSAYSAIAGAIEDTVVGVKSFVNNIKKDVTHRDNSVYVLKDSDGDVQYVGRTKDVKRRKNAHSKHPIKKNYNMTVVASGMNKIEARLMEQTLISAYTLKNLDNARREISKGNLAGYNNNIGKIVSIFNGIQENELLNLMER